MKFVVVFACVLLSPRCSSVPVEESVVSVYTTQSTTAGTSPSLDVYHQIANNIAERITSPIYRFLGYNSTATATETTTKQPWDKIELLDDPDLTKTHDMKPVDNDIASERDVEELSVAGLTKPDKKPEKFTLYSSLVSSYLPAKLESNDTATNEVDNDLDSLELDDVEPEKPREGPLIYVLEFFGSILQLLWGGLMALFKPTGNAGSR